MYLSHRPLLFIPLFLLTILITFYKWQSIRYVPTSDWTSPSWSNGVGQYFRPSQSSRKATNDLDNVQNRTLGFQEIKVISLPTRTDKHDAWALTASLTGFDYRLVDGVDSTKVSDKALPYTMNRKPKVVACWRAHMNVIQDIVNRGVGSTLVFEDDADWDVTLKWQLVQLARGTRWLLNDTSAGSSASLADSPYGSGWDFLWLGHCGATPAPGDPRRFVIPHDPTVEPSTIRDNGDNPHTKTWETADPPDLQTRIVAAQRDGICTAGYAISLEGARKVLYHMSMLPYDAPVDWGYSDMCRDRKSGFTCIAPIPRLIGTHRPAGDSSRYSDIETLGNKYQDAHSEGLVFSTRMNVDRLLRGETGMKSSDAIAKVTEVEEMGIREISSAVGHPEEIATEDED